MAAGRLAWLAAYPEQLGARPRVPGGAM